MIGDLASKIKYLHRIVLYLVDEKEVYEVIMKLRNIRNVVVDGIPANLIKFIAHLVASSLQYVINKIIITEVVPVLKMRNKLPITDQSH